MYDSHRLDQLDHLVSRDIGRKYGKCPSFSGLETVKRMHAAAATCPIVVLTVTDDEAVALETLRVGAQDYLTKGRIDSVLLTRALRYAIERRRAEQALRESEERFRMLYASIIDAVLVHRVATDGQPGLIVEANDAASRLLGYSRAEMLAKSIADFSLPLPGPDPRDIATRLPSGKGALFELVFTAKDGRHVFAEVHAGSLRHDGEDAVLYVIRDVTDQPGRGRDRAEERRAGQVECTEEPVPGHGRARPSQPSNCGQHGELVPARQLVATAVR
jgi:PAS domain S-box-containing protein